MSNWLRRAKGAKARILQTQAELTPTLENKERRENKERMFTTSYNHSRAAKCRLLSVTNPLVTDDIANRSITIRFPQTTP